MKLNSGPWDQKLKALAKERFSINAIVRETGLSKGQVTYRLSQFGLRLKDNRDGYTAESRLLLKRFDQLIATCVELRKRMP